MASVQTVADPLLPAPGQRRFGGNTQQCHDDETWITLADGRTLLKRSIAPGDLGAIKRLFARLSPDEIRRRFMFIMNTLPESMAQRFCTPDPALEAAWVLMDTQAEPAEMRGVGRIYLDRASNSAEFAVLVERAWTGRGLGARLMQQLVDKSRCRGLDELWGHVLIENRPMLDLCREIGFKRRQAVDDAGTTIIALDLTRT